MPTPAVFLAGTAGWCDAVGTRRRTGGYRCLYTLQRHFIKGTILLLVLSLLLGEASCRRPSPWISAFVYVRKSTELTNFDPAEDLANCDSTLTVVTQGNMGRIVFHRIFGLLGGVISCIMVAVVKLVRDFHLCASALFILVFNVFN